MYGLSRRNLEYDIDAITDEVRNVLDGPDCISGLMWNKKTGQTQLPLVEICYWRPSDFCYNEYIF